MKKVILFAIITFAFLTISVSAQKDVSVKFPKGSYEKTLSGMVQGRGYIDYIFKVDEYHFIDVTLKSTNKSVKFTITNPQNAAMKKGRNVRTFSGDSGSGGNFMVRVFVDGSSQRVMKYKLRIAAFLGT